MRCVSLTWMIFAAACASRSPTETAMQALMEATPAAQPGPAVALPCDWPVGTTVHYRYERRRLDSRTPGLEDVASVSPATLIVLGKDRLSLDIGETELTGPAHLVDAARAMLLGFDLSPMELVVKDGQLVDVANREALVTEILTMVQAMLPPETPPEAFAAVKATYEDPASATQLLLKEPNMLLGAICAVMGDGQRVETSVETPGLVGGPSLRSITTIDAEIRLDEGTATYTFSTHTDPESLSAAIEHYIKTVVPAAGEKLPPLPLPNSQSALVAVHSLADGLPISVNGTRTIVVGDESYSVRREERWSWTRVTPP